MLIVLVDEVTPRFRRIAVPCQDAVEMWAKLQTVSGQVIKEFFCAEHFGNLNKLVIVVTSVEEGLFAEDLRSTVKGENMSEEMRSGTHPRGA